MNKKQLNFVKEYVIHKPDVHTVDPIFDNILNEWSYKSFNSVVKVSFTYDFDFKDIKNIKTQNVIF